jgi:acetyl-CoA carboxylase carboxyl transferase subunit beta
MPIKLPSFRGRRETYPSDLWTKCPSCEEMIFNRQLDKTLRVCPTCGHHFRLSAEARLGMLLDPDTFEERDSGLQSVDPLGFVDQKPYPERVAAAQAATGMRDAAIWGLGRLDNRPVAICVMDFAFMGGSMGAVVGEKVTRAAEAAMEMRVPLIIVSASGGARMQEGTLALMQLAKTIGALERLRAEGVPFISILSDPTTGGVFASYAVLGDINLAEPNALIGFAGARVQAGTIASELPPGFQRSEFLYEHGFLDRVIPRADLRDEVARLLRYLVPAGFGSETVETVTVPAFRPLSFLTALAERVIPDSEPATPNGARGSNGQGAGDVSNGSGSVPATAGDGEAGRG